MKICSHCKALHPYTMFHKNKRMHDGYAHICKPCKKEAARQEYTRNKQGYYMRLHQWRSSDRGKKSIKATYQKMKRLYPERYKARTILNNAIARGTVAKPGVCSKCQMAKKVSAHHSDYSLPLQVDWLCYECHTGHHQNIAKKY